MTVLCQLSWQSDELSVYCHLLFSGTKPSRVGNMTHAHMEIGLEYQVLA